MTIIMTVNNLELWLVPPDCNI